MFQNSSAEVDLKSKFNNGSPFKLNTFKKADKSLKNLLQDLIDKDKAITDRENEIIDKILKTKPEARNTTARMVKLK